MELKARRRAYSVRRCSYSLYALIFFARSLSQREKVSFGSRLACVSLADSSAPSSPLRLRAVGARRAGAPGGEVA